MGEIFLNRQEAGQRLAEWLKRYRGDKSVIIYALPRGGVVVGSEISQALGAPLDLIVARKIGHPLNPEYAVGAVTERGEPIWNESELPTLSSAWQEKAVKAEREEANRRRTVYVRAEKAFSAKAKTAIIVDDGIATGLTMRAAVLEIQRQQPKRVVIAVPVAPKETVEQLQREADELVAAIIPLHFLGAIGAYYESFLQLTDEEVIKIIKRNKIRGRFSFNLDIPLLI